MSETIEQPSRQPGDVWAVPPMPPDKWAKQPIEVWHGVETELRRGWGLKLADAHRLVRGTERPSEVVVMDIRVARQASELGAPVGQLFTACMLRQRIEKVS